MVRQVGRGVGGHVVVGCEAQGSVGLGFGLLDGAGGLVGGHTAVGVGRVLVIRKPVRLVEHDVIQ